MYRLKGSSIEVLLVHPGGPFWAKKDDGAWSIPKGEYGNDEGAFQAAIREFEEETGVHPTGDYMSLGAIRQAGGKEVSAWAFEGDCDAASIRSNSFTMEWPPKSGRMQEFPEVDKGEWFSPEEAKRKLLKGQVGFVDRLLEDLGFAA